MLLVYGLGLAGAGVLLFMAGLRVFRRPQPPRWLQEGVSGDLLTVTVIGLVAIGVGLTGKFFADLPEQAFGLVEALWTVAVLAVLTFAGWLLRRRSIASAAQSDADASVVPLAAGVDSSPRPSGTPTGQPKGRGGRRKRAA